MIFSKLALYITIALLIASKGHARESFQSYDSLPKESRKQLSPAFLPVFHFKLDPGIDCTGAFISEKGHFITAQHCIAGCLAKNNALIRTRASDEPVIRIKNENIYTDKMTVNQDKIDSGISCPGTITGLFPGGPILATIVMTGGHGWLTPKESIKAFSRLYPDEQKHLFDNGYEHGYDFAILRAETIGMDSNKIKVPGCLKIGKSSPAKGEKLSTVSYACVDRMRLYTDGKTPLMSRGIRTSGFKDSRLHQLDKNGKRKPAFDPKLIDRNDTFFSSLDMEKCGSGSPVLNQDLQIVGIASRVYKQSTDYEFGSLESVDIAQVWQDLLKKKSGSEIKEITSCAELKAQ